MRTSVSEHIVKALNRGIDVMTGKPMVIDEAVPAQGEVPVLLGHHPTAADDEGKPIRIADLVKIPT